MSNEYILANRTINIYFQKSYKFLYPILTIPNKSIQPLQTFIAWEDHYQIKDCRLICVYELNSVLKQNETIKNELVSTIDPVTYNQFERTVLFRNEFFEAFFECEDNKGVYIFNLEKYKNDWIHFCNGRYSLFSEVIKNKIVKHYMTNSFSTEYMKSYLYPKDYFDKYSQLLNVDNSLLSSVGELCDIYNKDKETYRMKMIEILPIISTEDV